MKTISTIVGCLLIISSSTAQLYNSERHNTSYNTAWLSCTPSTSPNPDRPEGHWIMYDLRDNYELHQMHFWNLNDPSALENGLQDVEIDISSDGTSWTNAGSSTLAMSDGSAYYIGEQGINIGGTSARYVLIYATSNYGGSCYGLSEVKIDVQGAILPVTLVDFYADCKENGNVDVIWEVESEFNNEQYTLEKSGDGKSWTSIGVIPGLNKKERHTYSFQDRSPSPGKVFYRVEQQDFDGSISYFPLIASQCDNSISDLAIHPNPISGSAEISYEGKINGTATYKVTDISGKILKSGVMSNTRIEVDFHGLSPGTYFLQLDNAGIIYQEKLIKI